MRLITGAVAALLRNTGVLHRAAGTQIGIGLSRLHMSNGRKRRPRDPNQLGKLIVDVARGEVEDRPPKDHHPDHSPPISNRSEASLSRRPERRRARMARSICASLKAASA